jgi:chitinase
MNVSSKNAGLYSKYKGIYDETPWFRVENELLKDPAWERHWSAAVQVPWIYNPVHHIFFSYDDPHSIRLKAGFARRKHLLGTMFWVLGEDDEQNSLLRALYRQ